LFFVSGDFVSVVVAIGLASKQRDGGLEEMMIEPEETMTEEEGTKEREDKVKREEEGRGMIDDG